MLFSSCYTGKTALENSEQKDSLSVNEILIINAEICFNLKKPDDSTINVTTEILAIDSFTFKQNIDFRKTQIFDSIITTNDESKKLNYKKIIFLLDSIEKSLDQHINDYISYKYQIIKKYKYPIDSLKTSKVTEYIVTFYTDASPTREIIWLGEDIKHIIQDPIKNPDYYKRIDRLVSQTYDNQSTTTDGN